MSRDEDESKFEETHFDKITQGDEYFGLVWEWAEMLIGRISEALCSTEPAH